MSLHPHSPPLSLKHAHTREFHPTCWGLWPSRWHKEGKEVFESNQFPSGILFSIMPLNVPFLFCKSRCQGREEERWTECEGKRRGGPRGHCESRLTHRDFRAEVSLLPCVWLFWGCAFLFLLALVKLLHHTYTHTYKHNLNTCRIWGRLMRQVPRNGLRKASIHLALNYSTCD